MSSAEPSISVVMNCYNSAEFLREAIQSVLVQTYEDFELIFWDNQSTDSSASIVHSFSDSRIRYIMAPTHTLLGEARRLAMRQARGQWLAFLDCDDLWLPQKLEKQMGLIDSAQNPEGIGLIYGRMVIFGSRVPSGEIEAGPYVGMPLPEGRIFKQLLLTENFVPFLSALVRREAYFSCGEIPSHLRHSTDYYLFAAISRNFEAKVLQEICCKYRLHESNLTLSQKSVAYLESISVIEQFRKELTSEAGEEAVRSRLKTLHAFAGMMMILHERKRWQGLRFLFANSSFFRALIIVFKRFVTSRKSPRLH